MTNQTTGLTRPTILRRSAALRMKQLLEIVPIAPSTLWRWVKAGTFPAPVKLGAKTTAWRAEDIKKWMDSRE